MNYQITEEIRIFHQEDDWDFTFTTDEYGNIEVCYNYGLENMCGGSKSIHIPKSCIQHFINALEKLK